MMSMILCSLPDSYDTLITAIERKPKDDLTLNFVKTKLIDDYRRRKGGSSSNNQDEVALKVLHEFKKKCFFGKKEDYFEKGCLEYESWKNEKAKGEYKVSSIEPSISESLFLAVECNSDRKPILSETTYNIQQSRKEEKPIDVSLIFAHLAI